MPFIKRILLSNYRNYKSNSFEFIDGINIFCGKNGVGKTNILESISMLSPGKGFLSADIKEITTKSEKDWSIYATLENSENYDTLAVYTENEKKRIKINGNPIRGQDELNNIFNIIYLIPQMQNLLIGDKGDRRKFLDRCVYLTDSQHAVRVVKYEYYIKERMKVLQDNRKIDEKWLAVLEDKIAELGINISNIRKRTIVSMNKILEKRDFNFPKFDLVLESDLNILNFRQTLTNNRTKDKETKRTNDGPHKDDFSIFYRIKNLDAKNCSTGEQKLFLISLTLLKIFLCIEMKKATPVVLLDEVFSYLDDLKKKELFEEIKKLKIQSFITTNTLKVFDKIKDENINIINL
ncbi:MAG: DNA replication/repair protein RecF [Rickettsiales bacterium]|jgi:DNA replication and repair protein RecF|nr:DNA replication/repair protein RecF [Rickettsiales bacterium]